MDGLLLLLLDYDYVAQLIIIVKENGFMVYLSAIEKHDHGKQKKTIRVFL